MKYFITFLFAVLMLFSCTEIETTSEIEGMKPIYLSLDKVNIIKLEDTRSIESPGKIVYRPPYIFLVEKIKGVHIIDNNDPENPVFSAFIAIPGVVDIAVKGNILYADNFGDLVSIDFGDLSSITVIDRQEGVFPAQLNQESPPDYSGYFECVDDSKGKVIGWESDLLINPKCRK